MHFRGLQVKSWLGQKTSIASNFKKPADSGVDTHKIFGGEREREREREREKSSKASPLDKQGRRTRIPKRAPVACYTV